MINVCKHQKEGYMYVRCVFKFTNKEINNKIKIYKFR